MTKTAVHVTSLEQWKSVLDIWFKQGYEWHLGAQEYNESAFEQGGRFLYLDDITYNITNYRYEPFIEYSEFMGQKKEDNNMKTVYVTQDELDLIQELKETSYPLDPLLNESNRYYKIEDKLNSQEEKALLRYVGGDETIEFKVKEQLYCLWRIDEVGEVVYMYFLYGTPDWTPHKEDAFTAPLEEIKKHRTISWEIEEVY